MNKIELFDDESTIFVENYCAIPLSNVKTIQSIDGTVVLQLIEPWQDDEKIIEPIEFYPIVDAYIDPITEKRLNQLLEPAIVKISETNSSTQPTQPTQHTNLQITQGLKITQIQFEEIEDICIQNKKLIIKLNQNHPSQSNEPTSLVFPRYSINQKDLRLINYIQQTKKIRQIVE